MTSHPGGEFWNIVLYLIETHSPDLIIEEWKGGDSWTLARKISSDNLADNDR